MNFIKSLCLVVNTIASLIVISIVSVYVLSDYGVVDAKGNLPASQNHVDENFIETYTHFSNIYANTNIIHKQYTKLSHYIQGHDFHHPTDFCPECGLLQQLGVREEEIVNKVIHLSLRNNQLSELNQKESDEYKQNVEEINKLTIEKTLLRTYLFNDEERCREVNRLMKDKRLIGNDLKDVKPNGSPFKVKPGKFDAPTLKDENRNPAKGPF